MSDDPSLVKEFREQRAKAEAYLWSEMERLGMYARDGWSIQEFTREREGGSELVLRPLHRVKTAPEGLECVVRIRESAPHVDSHCDPPKKPE
jgi:hypothetical protein